MGILEAINHGLDYNNEEIDVILREINWNMTAVDFRVLPAEMQREIIQQHLINKC